MKSQSYVLTNEDNKIMAIIQAENSKVLKEKALKAISVDYDAESVTLNKSYKSDAGYCLTCMVVFETEEESRQEDFCLTLCEIY